MADVLIDTCAWIDFFRLPQGELGDAVQRLIESDRAVLTGPVLTELLHGTRTDRETAQLREALDVLPFVSVERADWERAGELLRGLRVQGITVPLTAALIAAVALQRGLLLLTRDKHFEHLEVGRWGAGKAD